ncbi:alpha/beta fold hydrolase [Streptomyces sp. NPDC007063]|uniref:alpha/beta fold hydrolase n=1 Tax=Streptomyces sp. NPDC007063 TaxID=3364772 RepID=UPI003688F25D
MTVRFTTSPDGTEIALERFGGGPPVVLTGGALSTRHEGLPLARELAGLGLSGVVYDRRGRGESGDTLPYAPAREAEDLAAVLGEVGAGAACAYGVSSGALIALGAAAGAGAAPGRLVLFEPPFTGAVGHPQDPARAARLAELLDRERRSDAVAYFLGEIIGLPPDSVEGARRSPAWCGLTRIAHTLRYDTTLLGDATLPFGVLTAVRVPALVLSSDASTRLLQDAARAVAEALPRGEHRTVSGAFHHAPAETLAPVVRDFLAAA